MVYNFQDLKKEEGGEPDLEGNPCDNQALGNYIFKI